MTDNDLRDLIAKLVESQIKTDAQLAKTDVQLAKTDAQLAKTDAQLAKTDAQLAKTDSKLDRLAEMYGGVSNNQGKVAEEFFYNSLKHNPVLNGVRFDFIEKNVTRSKDGIEEEYDILLVNGEVVYIIEVKLFLHTRDIDHLLTRKLPNFKKLFLEYKNYKILTAFASFSIADDLIKEGLEKGITLLQRRGDIFETLFA